MIKQRIIRISHPLSVIDGRKIPLKEAFSWILNYYNPNKDNRNVKSKVLDTTCSKMLMWHERDVSKFAVETNDIRKNIKANYHYNCKLLHTFLQVNTYDILIYDPP